jgi:hypothetical protein
VQRRLRQAASGSWLLNTWSAQDLHDTIQAELINKDDVDKYIDLHKQLGNIK